MESADWFSFLLYTFLPSMQKVSGQCDDHHKQLIVNKNCDDLIVSSLVKFYSAKFHKAIFSPRNRNSNR